MVPQVLYLLLVYMDLKGNKWKTSPRGKTKPNNNSHTSAKATSWLDPRDLVTTRTTYIIIIIIGTFILVYILLYSLVLLYPVNYSLQFDSFFFWQLYDN